MPSDRAKRAGSGSRWTRQIVRMMLQATHHLGAQISTAPGPWQERTRVIFEFVSLPRSAATLRNPGAPLGNKKKREFLPSTWHLVQVQVRRTARDASEEGLKSALRSPEMEPVVAPRARLSSTAKYRTIFEAKKKKPNSGAQWELDTRDRIDSCLLSRHPIVSAPSSHRSSQRLLLASPPNGSRREKEPSTHSQDKLSDLTRQIDPSRPDYGNTTRDWKRVIARAQVRHSMCQAFPSAFPSQDPPLGQARYQERAPDPVLPACCGISRRRYTPLRAADIGRTRGISISRPTIAECCWLTKRLGLPRKANRLISRRACPFQRRAEISKTLDRKLRGRLSEIWRTPAL